MALESPSRTRLFVLQGGHELGPLEFREVMDRLRTGVLALDDVCRLEGSEVRAPLRIVLPKIAPPLPSSGRAQRSTAISDSPSSLRSSDPFVPATGLPIHTGAQCPSTHDVGSLTADRAAIDSLHPKVVIKATPSPEPSSTAPQKTEAIPSPLPSPDATKNNSGVWGWRVAAALFALLVLVIGLQPRWSSSPQPNVQSTPAPATTATPPVASSPMTTPHQEKSPAETSPTPMTTATPQKTPGESGSVVDRMPGERFPATRLSPMSSWEVQNLTHAELRYAINEMYARHGTDFLDNEIRGQFIGYEWYHPVSGQTYDQTLSLFSTTERYNLKLLESYLATGNADAKTYPLTGVILEWNDGAIAVQKDNDRWEIAIDSSTNIKGDLKVGTKVMMTTVMTAIEVGPSGSSQGSQDHRTRAYQVTGEVMAVNDSMIAIQLQKGRYEVARNSNTNISTELKVGAKVTITYVITATEVEAKPESSSPQQTPRKPKILYAPQPPYPSNADKMHVTGSGRFKITFDEKGNAKSVEIVQSTENRALDSNTIKTFKQWRIAPGMPCYIIVPIDYRQKRRSGTSPQVSRNTSDFPIAKRVPGNPRYVFSPFDPNGRYVDVTSYAPGTKVKDPWTNKIFIVPETNTSLRNNYRPYNNPPPQPPFHQEPPRPSGGNMSVDPHPPTGPF